MTELSVTCLAGELLAGLYIITAIMLKDKAKEAGDMKGILTSMLMMQASVISLILLHALSLLGPSK